ncbi:hypothetical protein M8J76_015235 [Diaphorina citri]|nr:hypothetical protein M8J76_015235 [Diaphorina citri]
MLPCRLAAFSVLILVLSDVVVGSVNNSQVIELDTDNVDYVRDNYDFVLILFYVKWCRFSVAMLPTFDEVLVTLINLLPEPRKFAITKINCDDYESVCEDYNIVKYPTVKIMRHGSIEKLEYRRERTVEALVKYVREELMDPTIEIPEEENLSDKRRVIGLLSNSRPEEIDIFRKAATHFKTLCKFILHVKDTEDPTRIFFRPDPKSPETEEADMPHNGTITFPYLRDWANYKCVPFVREITFENAEELTEEGVPLFIFFYKPEEHTDLVKTFKKIVALHFVDDIVNQSLDFLVANANDFQSVLDYMNITGEDLPIILIDNFEAMFIYEEYGANNEKLLDVSGLKKFIQIFRQKALAEFKKSVLGSEEKIFQDKDTNDEVISNEYEDNPDNTEVPIRRFYIFQRRTRGR